MYFGNTHINILFLKLKIFNSNFFKIFCFKKMLIIIKVTDEILFISSKTFISFYKYILDILSSLVLIFFFVFLPRCQNYLFGKKPCMLEIFPV